jgi:hypothetical protein
MKLELLTNATVVDDAVRFIASHAATIEKANSDKMVTVDEEVNNKKNDIQGSNENRSYEQPSPEKTTNNTIF